VATCIAQSQFLTKYVASQKKRGIDIPEDDIMLECREIMQTTSTEFRDPTRQKAAMLSERSIFLPQSICQWVNFHHDSISWFMLLPPLANMLQSVHRARAAQNMLDVSLSLDRTIEAFTLPSANSSFNNQRLETFGDAFLKLATCIHVFNKFPYKHEGQLTLLKDNSVSNRYLLGRGHVRNLVGFMNNEPNSQTKWRLTTESTKPAEGGWVVERKIARRSVQDCMEALIGVGWLSGGVQGGLAVGTKLDLCFGGTDAWWDRYPGVEARGGTSFTGLEEALGYHFKNQGLVMEALTHPSFARGGPCYQRLEFLGDGT
jgi:endoribonuclease Dicer